LLAGAAATLFCTAFAADGDVAEMPGVTAFVSDPAAAFLGVALLVGMAVGTAL
jgi:hypothetical protein